MYLEGTNTQRGEYLINTTIESLCVGPKGYTFCQMSSNVSTPSDTLLRHLSISPKGGNIERQSDTIWWASNKINHSLSSLTNLVIFACRP